MDSVEFGTRVLIFIIVLIVTYPVWALGYCMAFGIFESIYKIIFGSQAFIRKNYDQGGFHGIPYSRSNQGVDEEYIPLAVRLADLLLFIPVIYFVYYVSSLIW